MIIYVAFSLRSIMYFIFKQKAISMNATLTLFNGVHDAVFPNDSLISTNWTQEVPGCSVWKKPNHVLFQVANGIVLLGLLAPECLKHGILFLHSTFVIGNWQALFDICTFPVSIIKPWKLGPRGLKELNGTFLLLSVLNRPKCVGFLGLSIHDLNWRDYILIRKVVLFVFLS